MTALGYKYSNSSFRVLCLLDNETSYISTSRQLLALIQLINNATRDSGLFFFHFAIFHALAFAFCLQVYCFRMVVAFPDYHHYFRAKQKREKGCTRCCHDALPISLVLITSVYSGQTSNCEYLHFYALGFSSAAEPGEAYFVAPRPLL